MAAQSASSAELVTSLCFAASPGANFFDSPLEFRKVRPRPVDLFAVRTAAELVVIDFGERFEFADYLGLGYRFQRCVTSQAARERRDQFQKVKTADNLDRLFVGVLGPRPISVLNDGVHEETPITRQKRSIFADHHLEQLPVISVLAVGDIKSEQAKIARETSQMSISNKSYKANDL